MERVRAKLIMQSIAARGFRFQKELAVYVDVKNNYITKWKTGRIKNPRNKENLIKLGREFLKHCSYYQVRRCIDLTLLPSEEVMDCLRRTCLEVMNESRRMYAEAVNNREEAAVVEYKLKQTLKEKFDYDLE